MKQGPPLEISGDAPRPEHDGDSGDQVAQVLVDDEEATALSLKPGRAVVGMRTLKHCLWY